VADKFRPAEKKKKISKYTIRSVAQRRNLIKTLFPNGLIVNIPVSYAWLVALLNATVQEVYLLMYDGYNRRNCRFPSLILIVGSPAK
jgi:hypothetical protein